MITATKALKVLKENGLIESYVIRRMDCEIPDEPYSAYTEVAVVSGKLAIYDESFGDESFLFIKAYVSGIIKKVEQVIKKAGGKPDFSWCPENPDAFQLRVKSFKGKGWWE